MNSIVPDKFANEQVLNSRIDRFFNQINISNPDSTPTI